MRTIRTVRESPAEVVADVALHSAFYYEKGGMTHREDVVESERLTFEREKGGWEIVNVERRVPERSGVRKVVEKDPSLRLSEWGRRCPIRVLPSRC